MESVDKVLGKQRCCGACCLSALAGWELLQRVFKELGKQPWAVLGMDKDDSSSFLSAFMDHALLRNPSHPLVTPSSPSVFKETLLSLFCQWDSKKLSDLVWLPHLVREQRVSLTCLTPGTVLSNEGCFGKSEASKAQRGAETTHAQMK